MYVMPHQVTTKAHCPSTRLVREVVRSTGCKAIKAHVTPMWSARPHHLRRLLCSEVVITLPQLRKGSRATGRIACLLLSRVRMCTSHRGLRNIDNQPLYCWSPQRCWSTRALPLLHLHLSRSTLAPPLRHTTFHHRARHRQAVWAVRISVNLSHASASMPKHSPAGRLDSGNAPASDTERESISRVSVFTGQPPPGHTTATLRTRSYYQQTKDPISGGLSSILAYI